MTTGRLRIVAIAVPLLYLFLVEALSIFLLVPLMGHRSLVRLFIVGTILIVGTVPFSIWLFSTLERHIVMTREISERQRVEAEYRAIFDATGDGLVIYTTDGIVVAANPAFCAMHGYTREQLIGHSVTMVIHPDSRGLFREFVQAIAREGAAYARATNVRHDGTAFPVDAHGTFMVYDGALHILGVVHDVTATVRAQELEEVRAARDHLERWNKELAAEVAAHTREIERTSRELTTRVLQAQERERQRISRELHDETAQSLSTLLINLDFLERHAIDHPAVLDEGLERVRTIAQRTLDEVRTLSHALRPSILDDLGLAMALRWCAKEHTATFGVPVEVQVEQPPAGRLDPEVELTIFRMAQEALNNSGKHAQAEHATLDLSFPRDTVLLVVEDDGIGFDPNSLQGPSRQGGLGLHGMQERADLIGATVAVSSKPGGGTRVTVIVPLRTVEDQPVLVGAGSSKGDL